MHASLPVHLLRPAAQGLHTRRQRGRRPRDVRLGQQCPGQLGHFDRVSQLQRRHQRIMAGGKHWGGQTFAWLSIVSKHSTAKFSEWEEEIIERVEKDAFEYLQEAKDEISSLAEAPDSATMNVRDSVNSVVDPVIVEKCMIEAVCRIAGVKNCDHCEN